jgi:hypothetical protein
LKTRKKITVFFNVDTKIFLIEYTHFVLDGLQCCHIEFGQKVGPFIAQFTMNNMSRHHALVVLRTVVRETQERYGQYDLVVFSSLDGNSKRNAIYERIAKDMVKQQECQLDYTKRGKKGKIFILHRGVYTPIIEKKLQIFLAKNGLFSLGGRILTLYYKARTLAHKITQRSH